ncbi:MAG: sulfate transporter CysZ [Gammaproteobacteria bacterium]|nr:sulfate transporter CysZ [Gammaproteobacteria bacterium]
MSAPQGGFLGGLAHIWRGFGLLRAPGVRVYVVVPLLINVALFVVALGSLGEAVDYTIARYLGNLPEFVQWLAWLLFATLAAVIVFFSFSVVANLVASPFNGLLAEAVERHLRGDQTAVPFSLGALLGEVARTVLAELRKLLYMVLWALPLLVLSVIPGLNAIAPALWLLFGAWMLSMEYLDCPLGNHGEVFPRVLQAMRARRRLTLGFGFGMTAVTLVPVLNFIAVPLGVAAATSLYCAHLAPDGAR